LVKGLEFNLPANWVSWQALVSVSYYVEQSNIFAFSMDIEHIQGYLRTLGTVGSLLCWQNLRQKSEGRNKVLPTLKDNMKLMLRIVAASLIYAQHDKIFGASNECTNFHVKSSIMRIQWL
jgi:hypothetical protein